MALKYSCFISYPYNCSQARTLRVFIKQLKEALADEISMLIDNSEIYVDFKEVENGSLHRKLTKQQELQELFELLSEKLTELRNDYAITLESAKKFQLKKQIKQAEKERTDIETELDILEQEIKKIETHGNGSNGSRAKALCMSGCMILVFTPTYFSKKQIPCAAEYKAMEILEKERLKLLGSNVKDDVGMIIPILIRGRKEKIPKEIRERYYLYDFSKYTLHVPHIISDSFFIPQIQEIAEKIAHLYERFESLSDDPCQICEQFDLLEDATITNWLETIQVSPLPFPGRKR